MSFNAVKELRLAGRLEEALQMANQNLEEAPDNIWNKRAAAWVHHDYLKKYAQPKSFAAFKQHLTLIKDLQLPEEEKMLFDQCAWKIGSLVFGLQKELNIDYGKINELFEIIRDFHFTKPSEPYSNLFKAFFKGHTNWSNYLAFADWWNFDYFSAKDYLEEEFHGNKNLSTVEQAYIAYAKKLLGGGHVDSSGQEGGVDQEKIHSFLPKLDALIRQYPAFLYPPYFKAKLLLALGNRENVLSAFLPFALQKRNDYWVWELMAEIFSNDRDIQFACYCKALSLKTSDDFLVKLRATFAEMLVERKLFDEAKTEIQKIISTREKHQWRLPNQIVQWTEQDWYSAAATKTNNIDLYSRHLKQAEEVLFRDIPEELIAVEFVNENKQMLNFVKDKQKFGFFNYAGILTKPQIGELLKVRFRGNGQDGFYKVLTAKKADSNMPSEAIKDFEGTIKIIAPQNFGFIDDIFVEPRMIEKNLLTEGQSVQGRAVLSFNKKKKEWGWKAIAIK